MKSHQGDNMKRFILVLFSVLLSSIAYAEPGVVVGGYDVNGKFWPNRGASDGSITTRSVNNSYDHWNLLNAGFQVTDIGAQLTVKAPIAVAVQDFNQINLMVSFAPADTDTVAFDIFIVAKQSTQVADGIDMIWDSDDADSSVSVNPATNEVDGFFVCNRLGYSAFPATQRSSRVYFIGKYNNTSTIKGTGGALTSLNTTTAAVYIPLTTKSGDYVSFPIIQIWVRNRKGTQLDDLTIDLWCHAR